MALADRDQVILDTIAAALSAEDPQLAALLAVGAPGAALVLGPTEEPRRRPQWWPRPHNRRGGGETDGGHGQRDDGEPDEPIPA